MKKIIREILFEKFTENSDPIKDLRIGEYARKIDELHKKLLELWDENYSDMVVNDIDRGRELDIIEKIQHIIDNIFRK